jgi:DNA (cytosine-5)-methyltransferase 1
VPPGSFYMKYFTPRGKPGQMCKDVRTAPFGTITSYDHHALVVPYRRGRAKSTGEPLLTLGTRDSAGLCSVEAAAMDCYYRMLTPREHLRGQRFRDDYEVKGNLGEQTMQAGNAVPCNVAQWIGSKLAEALA